MLPGSRLEVVSCTKFLEIHRQAELPYQQPTEIRHEQHPVCGIRMCKEQQTVLLEITIHILLDDMLSKIFCVYGDLIEGFIRQPCDVLDPSARLRQHNSPPHGKMHSCTYLGMCRSISLHMYAVFEGHRARSLEWQNAPVSDKMDKCSHPSWVDINKYEGISFGALLLVPPCNVCNQLTHSQTQHRRSHAPVLKEEGRKGNANSVRCISTNTQIQAHDRLNKKGYELESRWLK